MVRKNYDISLDVDDVLMKCNEYALSLINEKRQEEPIRLEQINHWGKQGNDIDQIFDYYNQESFWENQPLYPGAQEFVKELSKFCNIFIMTAIDSKFMDIRTRRLREAFPEIPAENIMFSTRKDMSSDFDFVLDDRAKNIKNSKAKYPILFRRPWNHCMSGMLAVNSYEEALNMIRNIIEPTHGVQSDARAVCVVGPSGSNKTEFVKQICDIFPSFERPVSDYTGDSKPGYNFCSVKAFFEKEKLGQFLETSVYAGKYYGLEKASIDAIISDGKRVIMPVDICGAMAVKMHYPDTSILFINSEDEDIYKNIISRNITDEEKVARLVSLNSEKKNIYLSDCVINHDSVGNMIEEFARTYL